MQFEQFFTKKAFTGINSLLIVKKNTQLDKRLLIKIRFNFMIRGQEEAYANEKIIRSFINYVTGTRRLWQ